MLRFPRGAQVNDLGAADVFDAWRVCPAGSAALDCSEGVSPG
jgi:hypothetical protein